MDTLHKQSAIASLARLRLFWDFWADFPHTFAFKKNWGNFVNNCLRVSALFLSLFVYFMPPAHAQLRQAADAPVSLAQVSLSPYSPVNTYPHSRILNHSPSRGGATFSENFESGSIPAGWVLIDNDGLTPDPNVAFVTEAWVVVDDDSTDGNFVAVSTSWYTPVGQADDWMITPLVSLLGSARLSWRAQAPDPGFADGYEVYISTSTPDLVGCQIRPSSVLRRKTPTTTSPEK